MPAKGVILIIYKLIHHRIGLSRQILLTVSTIIVKYRLKPQNGTFNSHAKQNLGNIEGVTENTVPEF